MKVKAQFPVCPWLTGKALTALSVLPPRPSSGTVSSALWGQLWAFSRWRASLASLPSRQRLGWWIFSSQHTVFGYAKRVAFSLCISRGRGAGALSDRTEKTQRTASIHAAQVKEFHHSSFAGVVVFIYLKKNNFLTSWEPTRWYLILLRWNRFQIGNRCSPLSFLL